MRSALRGGLLLRLLPALEAAAANDTDSAVASLQPGDLLLNATRPCCCRPESLLWSPKPTKSNYIHSHLCAADVHYHAQVSFKECNHGCPASLRFQHCTVPNCRVQSR